MLEFDVEAGRETLDVPVDFSIEELQNSNFRDQVERLIRAKQETAVSLLSTDCWITT